MARHTHGAPASRTARCALTGADLRRDELVDVDTIWPAIADRIRRDHPDLPPDALVSRTEISRYRNLYFRELLAEERGELTALEADVAESLAGHDLVVSDTERDYEEKRKVGEVLSDGLASFGGSWSFLIAFGLTIAVWIAYNVARSGAFDPFPFILLNLVLSCIAAVQAPIIMMSQKRQEAKDRIRALNDYRVNLKAELEIRQLHEKVDHLLTRQGQRLAEIQELQIELMEEARGRAR